MQFVGNTILKYKADELQKLDPLEHIRSNPEMYTGQAIPNPAMIAATIAQDAMVLGACDTRVFLFNQWWIIAADIDWLSAPCKHSASPIDTFNRVLAFPECGANSMRHEILATAFASCVISLSRTDRFIVSGDVAEDDPVWTQMLADGVSRSVAFRMASSS